MPAPTAFRIPFCRQSRRRIDSPEATEVNAPSPEDALIDQVQTALRASGYSCLERVDVVSENGRLILSGRVPSWFLKQVAQTAVLKVERTARLENHIEVG